jgi:hypothetical protein
VTGRETTPEFEVLVARSVRWPLDLDLRVTRVALERKRARSEVIRELTEAGLALLDRPPG